MKQKFSFRSGFIILVLPLLLITACSKQQNWPQFRGPESNMLTTAKNLPEEWGNDKNVAWTYKMDGPGWSSPVVWGDKVFITSAVPIKMNPVPERGPMPGQPGQNPPQGPPPQEVIDTSYLQEIYRWQVTCIDLKTGEELWKQTAYEGAPKTGKNPNSTYACETPVTDGKRVYAYFGMHGLFCFDVNGNLLWEKNLGVFNTQRGWGTGSSPLLYRNVLFIQNDNEENSFIAALDAATGEEKWRVRRDEKTNYSTPIIWKNKIRTELITAGKTARSYDPETGKLLWELKTGGEQAIPSPVGNQDMLYVGNAGGREVKGFLFAVKAGAEGDITPADSGMLSEGVAWINPDANIGNASPLLYNGKLYIISSRGGEILCLDASDGEVVYKGRVPGLGAVWASPWVYNNKVWFFDERGLTLSLSAGDTFEYASDNRLDDKFWASVAITDNAYLFKGVEKLYCVRQ
ncbi:MAG: hypothetical protein A2Y71_17135 [Bacteroidetes bacterium RBG_13_42_15]|nr:MAG: hypothetical protein A2Y71_17135 [Bacteroidetes bacterium RBG_13_42_15]